MEIPEAALEPSPGVAYWHGIAGFARAARAKVHALDPRLAVSLTLRQGALAQGRTYHDEVIAESRRGHVQRVALVANLGDDVLSYRRDEVVRAPA